MQLFRSHGITRDQSQMAFQSDGPWYYEQIELGFNYRITDLQAALGLSQMTRLDEFVTRRNELAMRYDHLFEDTPLFIPKRLKDTYSSFHLYVIQLNLQEINQSHLQVFTELRQKGIGVNLHYIPVYSHPYYQSLGFSKGYCPNAEIYYSRAISIPMFSALTNMQQDFVVNSLNEIIQK